MLKKDQRAVILALLVAVLVAGVQLFSRDASEGRSDDPPQSTTATNGQEPSSPVRPIVPAENPGSRSAVSLFSPLLTGGSDPQSFRTDPPTEVPGWRSQGEPAAPPADPVILAVPVPEPRPAVAAETEPLACASTKEASEHIIATLDRIAARLTVGELMPWDAREASEALGAASQMLARNDPAGACTTIAGVRRKLKLP